MELKIKRTSLGAVGLRKSCACFSDLCISIILAEEIEGMLREKQKR